MLGGVQNLHGLWNWFNFNNQADEYIHFFIVCEERSLWWSLNINFITWKIQQWCVPPIHRSRTRKIWTTNKAVLKPSVTLICCFEYLHLLNPMKQSLGITKPKHSFTIKIRASVIDARELIWWGKPKCKSQVKALGRHLQFFGYPKTKWKPRAGFCWQPVMNFKIFLMES